MSRRDLNLLSALKKDLARSRRVMGGFLNLGMDFTETLDALVNEVF